MRKNTFHTVTITGIIAILSILIFQIYWLSQSWKDKGEALDQTIQIALQKAAENIAAYNDTDLAIRDLVHRRSTNYYVVNIDDVIDANILEYYVRAELTAIELTLDFEYAIYDCDKDEMVYGNYCSAEEVPAADPSENLPKYDQFTYYFGVRFPQIRGMIFSQLTITLVLSGLLLLTLMFFAYALYVILSQKRLTDLQKEFINNMTHEFKTPISSISIGAKTFLSSDVIKTDPRLHKYAEVIHGQAARLNNQVEKILDIARLEKDQIRLNKERVNLHDVIHHVVESQHNRLSDLDGKIEMDLQADQWMISADLLHLTNVLHNLVDNAIKYKKDIPEIKIATKTLGRQIEVRISDNGIGIDKSEHSRVFDKFYRVPTGNVHNAKGFGLGLFYVRQITKLHGWTVDLKSAIGDGTTFIFLIPIDKNG
jgi:two-component system phosphate regulon sensor histidine kinase PhoR